MRKQSLAIPLGILIVLIFVVAWVVPRKEWAWVLVAGLLFVFMAVLGQGICGRPLGILITEQNVMSLARFQAVLWTLLVISAYCVIALARIHYLARGDNIPPGFEPLNIELNTQLLGLLGISTSALVLSPLIAATKKSKEPDKTDPQVKSADKTAVGDQSAAASASSGKAEGILFKNTKVMDARFTDIFEGDELANNNHVDLGKVQMFYFTVIVALTYAVMLWTMMSAKDTKLYDAAFAFPGFSQYMVVLLGISNAGYLANKGVDHTKKADQ